MSGINLISSPVLPSGTLVADNYTFPNGSSDSLQQLTKVNNTTVDAAFEIQSTTGALLIPRVTTVQRDELVACVGMIVYNIDTDTYDGYNSTDTWIAFGEQGGGPVIASKVSLGDGTEALPSLTFISDPDTGLYRPAPNILGITTAGKTQLLVSGTSASTAFLTISGDPATPYISAQGGTTAGMDLKVDPDRAITFTSDDTCNFCGFFIPSIGSVTLITAGAESSVGFALEMKGSSSSFIIDNNSVSSNGFIFSPQDTGNVVLSVVADTETDVGFDLQLIGTSPFRLLTELGETGPWLELSPSGLGISAKTGGAPPADFSIATSPTGEVKVSATSMLGIPTSGRMRFLSASTVFGVSLTSPASMLADVDFTLPGDIQDGLFLTTNALGVMSWADPSNFDEIYENIGTGELFVGTTAGNQLATGSDSLTFVGVNVATAYTANIINSVGLGTNVFPVLDSNSNNNIGIGANVGPLMTDGGNNTIVGSNCFSSVISGVTGTTCIGSGSIQALTAGNNNTVVGATSGNGFASFNNSTIIGRSADVSGVDATNATAIGFGAAASSNSVCLGNNINFINTGALGCTLGTGSVPFSSLYLGPTSDYIQIQIETPATGRDYTIPEAGENADFWVLNTARTKSLVGPYIFTDANFNFAAVSSTALAGITSGLRNIAIGVDTLTTISSNSFSVAVGDNAGHQQSGASNTWIGTLSGGNATGTGTLNSALGRESLSGITSGGSNVGVGYQAGSAISSGGSNVCIGATSGASLATGSNNICIGKDADVGSASSSNRIAIGFSVVAGVDDQAVIGNDSLTSIINEGTVGLCKLGTTANPFGTLVLGVSSTSNVTISPAATAAARTYTLTDTQQNANIVVDAPLNVTGATQQMVVGSTYISDRATAVTYTLPTAAVLGERIRVRAYNTGGWVVAQNASQFIRIGNQITTTGVGGSLASTAQGDCIELECVLANNGWMVVNSFGNITVV